MVKISRKYKVIYEKALQIMLSYGFDAAKITTVCDSLKLPISQLNAIYSSNDHLRFAAMKYAAVVWVHNISKELEIIQTTEEKLWKLIHSFAAGANSHPHSLALYIDAWKKIKDYDMLDIDNLKDELHQIYKIYTKLFVDVIKEMNIICHDEYKEIIGWIMVVISDGFFIQTLCHKDSFDFDNIANVLYNMILSYCQLQQKKI